jgi:hypothetical protein
VYEAVVAVRAVRREQDPERGEVSLGVRLEIYASVDDRKGDQELEFQRHRLEDRNVTEVKLDLVEIAWFAVLLMGTARQALPGWGIGRRRWECATTW